MKTNFHRSLTTMLVISFLALGGAFTASCSKAAATSKKDKLKKAAKEELETEIAETESGKTDEHEQSKDEHAAETEDPAAKKGERETAKPGEKKKPGTEGKPAGKPPVKDAKAAAADEIWARLAQGNKRFMAGKRNAVNYAATRKTLAKEQSPEVVVLGCADSRVPPEFIFDKNLGEMFVVRDAGNIPDRVTLGSIEYAVEHLHAKALLILGHESCGAVAAAVSGEEMPSANMTAIVDGISPAFEGSKTCVIGQPINISCVELNVKQSSDDVVARSPILKKAVKAGELAVIRAVYKMETGEVVRLD